MTVVPSGDARAVDAFPSISQLCRARIEAASHGATDFSVRNRLAAKSFLAFRRPRRMLFAFRARAGRATSG
jgi:hypothetical protein